MSTHTHTGAHYTDVSNLHLCLYLKEGRAVVLEPVLAAVRADHLIAELAQLVARHPGTQVVLCLELEAAVEPIHPLGVGVQVDI